MTWVERKVLGRMQLRYGPGWHIWKWDVSGEVVNVPISLVLIFALSSLGIYGFIVGGWASDSKYALLGSMRTCAQMVSYEVSLTFAVLGVVLMGQSLSLVDIVQKQASTFWFFGPQFVGLMVFFVAGVAETNRPPFDLPEADTELVAGYHTEYSGMRWGLFQTAEYINMITLSGLAIALFFGGWHGPWLSHELGPLWFAAKLRQVFRKPITQQYPEFKRPVYPRFRGRHRLHRHENGLEKCVGCSLCAAACPADCIRVVAAENTADNRVSAGERYARIYEINLSRCIFCGYCELACPFDAITLGNEFEISEYSRDDLIYTKDMLLAEPIKKVPVADRELYDTPIPYYQAHS